MKLSARLSMLWIAAYDATVTAIAIVQAVEAGRCQRC